MSTTYKKYRTAADEPIQVDSAIRDGLGKNIANNYAKQTGSYETLHSGSSTTTKSIEPLTDDSGVEQTSAFYFQATGTDDNSSATAVGNVAKLQSIRGNGFNFNQLLKAKNFTSTQNDVTLTMTADGLVTIIGTASAQCDFIIFDYGTGGGWPWIKGHKYIFTFTDNSPIYLRGMPGSINSYRNTIATCSDSSNSIGRMMLTVPSGTVCNERFYLQLFDISAMNLSSEIKNLVDFKKLFPDNYYHYTDYSTVFAKSTKLETVGYNQLDASTLEQGGIDSNGAEVSDSQRVRSGFIDAVPGQAYTCHSNSSISLIAIAHCYDAGKVYIGTRVMSETIEDIPHSVRLPDNCFYIRVVFSKDPSGNITPANIVEPYLHITWDKTGYEPYVKHEYALPNVELHRAGTAYDEILPDGTLIQRVGVVDLGGTVSIEYNSTYGYFLMYCPDSAKMKVQNSGDKNVICANFQTYETSGDSYISNTICANDRVIVARGANDNWRIYLTDKRYTDVASFKNAYTGVKVYYPLLTPVITTVEERAYLENIEVDDYGTMKFVPETESELHVKQGNSIFYSSAYVALLDDLYNHTEGDAYNVALVSQINDIENGAIIVGKSSIAKQIENVSETSGSTQTNPFLFQATGTNNNTTSTATAPVAQQLELRGKTIKWNQLVQHGNFDATTGWTANQGTLTVNNNVGTLTASGSSNYLALTTYFDIKASHKYLFKMKINSSHFSNFTRMTLLARGVENEVWANDISATGYAFFTPTKNNTFMQISPISTDETYTGYVELENCMCFDLTDIFGAGNEPTSIEEFNRIFPKLYYEYNAGTLLSCKSNSLVTVGCNALSLDRTQGSTSGWVGYGVRNFEEGKYYKGLSKANNYNSNAVSNVTLTNNSFSVTATGGYGACLPVRVIAGMKYAINFTITSGDTEVYIQWFDADGNFITNVRVYDNSTAIAPDNAYWGAILNRPNTSPAVMTNIMFHLSWDESHDYVPYEKHEYALPDIELRSAGSAYDVITPDGTLIRRIKIINLDELNWTQSGNGVYYYSQTISDIVKPANNAIKVNGVSDLAEFIIPGDIADNKNTGISIEDQGKIRISTSLYSSIAGKHLYAELAEPTTEKVASFAESIDVDDFGTMEFIPTLAEGQAVAVPQGNKFFYPADYVLFLDDLYNYCKEDDSTDVNTLAKKEDLQALREEIDVSVFDTITSTEVVTGLYKNVVPYTSGISQTDLVFLQMSNGAVYPMINNTTELVVFNGTAFTSLTIVKAWKINS